MQKDLERKAYGRLKEWKKSASRSTLEISGARQVGKTYLVNKFADAEYRQKIYINLLEFSGELFLEKYHELRRQISGGYQCENPVLELIRQYEPDFRDSKDTIVIIDEIQESAEIYNRIREFTRNLESDFIVTGSYLGRILDKGFKYSAGDLDSLEIHTLDFEEFLTALDKHDLYENMDLCGGSDAAVYQELQKLYEDYCKVGGYPGVVLQLSLIHIFKIIHIVREKLLRRYSKLVYLFYHICKVRKVPDRIGTYGKNFMYRTG